jgi:hypothetical protein
MSWTLNGFLELQPVIIAAFLSRATPEQSHG